MSNAQTTPKKIVREVGVSEWIDDSWLYEIRAEVTLPINWTQFAENIKVLWAKKWAWASGAGAQTEIAWADVPPYFQTALLGAAATKAKNAGLIPDSFMRQ